MIKNFLKGYVISVGILIAFLALLEVGQLLTRTQIFCLLVFFVIPSTMATLYALNKMDDDEEKD